MASANYVAQSNQMYGGTVNQNYKGGVLEGVGNWASNLFTGDIDYARQLETLGFQNQFNAEQAQLNRDFQERMANTAYQRAVADMKSAGLNPYLAYSQGGSSTPGGNYVSSAAGIASSSGRGALNLLSTLVSLIVGGVNAGARIASASELAKKGPNVIINRKYQNDVYNIVDRY